VQASLDVPVQANATEQLRRSRRFELQAADVDDLLHAPVALVPATQDGGLSGDLHHGTGEGSAEGFGIAGHPSQAVPLVARAVVGIVTCGIGARRRRQARPRLPGSPAPRLPGSPAPRLPGSPVRPGSNSRGQNSRIHGERLIITPAPPLPEHEIQLSLCPRRSATIPRRWWDHPLLSPGSLTFRFPASALVNSSSRTFAGTRSSDLAMGAEIAVIKAQAVAYDSSVPHDGVI